eukprot:gene9333-3009_t
MADKESVKKTEDEEPMSPRPEVGHTLALLEKEIEILETLPSDMKLGSLTTRDVAMVDDCIKFNEDRLLLQGGDNKAENELLGKLKKRLLTLKASLEKTLKEDGGEFSGDRDDYKETWAPLKMPFNRRLQTFTIIFTNFFTGIPIYFFGFFSLFWIPLLWPVLIVYLLWCLFQPIKHPLKLNRWVQNVAPYHHMRDYFPMRLRGPYADQFDKDGNYFFVYHPHGVHGFGASVNFMTTANKCQELFPGLKIHCQTLWQNFRIPLWREVCIACGCGDASKECITKTLTGGPGQSVVLVVGGAEEALHSSPNTSELTLKKRKGFLKIALRTGKPLVPMFGYGETDLYTNW